MVIMTRRSPYPVSVLAIHTGGLVLLGQYLVLGRGVVETARRAVVAAVRVSMPKLVGGLGRFAKTKEATGAPGMIDAALRLG